MTYKQRVIEALSFRQTQRVPCHVMLTTQARDTICAYTGNPRFAQTCMDNHLTLLDYSGFLRPVPGKAELFEDDFGVQWDRSGVDKDVGVVARYQIQTVEDYDAYTLPPVPEQALRAMLETGIAAAGDTFVLGGIGFSLFERAWSLRGMENLLMDMLTEPERVERLLTQICEYNLKIMEIAFDYALDGFHFGDDWGQQRGLIMGPKLWRKFIKPQMRTLYAKAHARVLWVTQHSCGDLREILDDLVEIGLNAYNTVQPEIYDLALLKQKYGGSLAFWGGISTQRDLAVKTPAEITQITIATLRLMSKGGGYIAAPTHAVEFDVPPENLLAMLEAFHTFQNG